MSLFPLKKIAALAGGRQAYLRGVAAYNAGQVHDLTVVSDTAYAEYLTARVEDRAADAAYAVEVGLSAAGEVAFYACDCGHRDAGACKHVVAVLTHKYYRDMVNGMPPATHGTTPPALTAARRMLDGYFREARTAIRAATPNMAVLIPALHLGTPPTLTLSVGLPGERSYAVKDVVRFREALRAGETAEYGAALTLTHHPDAFDPESRPLLSLIAGAALSAGAGAHTRRECPLTPTELDRFFALYKDTTLPVSGRETRLTAGDPPLTLSVTAEGDGVTLSAPTPRFAPGESGLYIQSGDTLYAASPAASAALRGLLFALREGEGRLALPQKELAEFCAAVLPRIEPFVTFEGDTDRFDPYRPLPLSAVIYVDSPEPSLLTARVEFRYGARLVPPAEAGDDGGDLPRDTLGEWRVLGAVSALFPRRRSEPGVYEASFSDDDLYDFLTLRLPERSRVAEIYTSDAFREIRVLPPPPVSVGVRMDTGLLRLDLDLGGLDPEELTALLDSYRRRKRYHRLRSGQFLSLDDPALLGLSRLSEGLGVTDRQLRRGHLTLPAFRAPFVDRVLAESRGLAYTRDESCRKLLNALRQVEDNGFSPPASLETVLRPYQKTGFSWLRTMEECGFGGILADDMGLGKTVQMIALLLDARERGVTLPSLVVCPASLILNWESEIRRFAPALPVRTVMGDSAAREELLADIRPGEVVVTSYDLLKRDIALYEGKSFYYHVLDEAQIIKNHNTQNARAVKAIDSVQRFALTGTPVENRLSELWSIFDFLMPGFLFSYARFRERFERPAVRDGDEEALTSLSRLCAPFLLRRLKKEVLRELPPKSETVLCVPMGETQHKTYVAAAMQMRQNLAAREADGRTRLQALTMLTRLRQICCDPALCYENYRGGSAKLESCLSLVKQAVETGHRVLLFSQFTSMLARIEERLRQEEIPTYTLQGSTPKEKRAALVAAFEREEGAPVFLISLKAGGTGLNLTAADVVIHYDPWWNLSVQNQATDRAHRIGQQRPVQVYKLIAKDTVEEKILHLQSSKQSLADAVVRADGESLSFLSDEELLALIGG